MKTHPIPLSIPVDPAALVAMLVPQLVGALVAEAKADPAGAVADLLRGAAAEGIRTHLGSLGLVPVETIAAALGWSVRRFRAEARERHISGAEADGAGLVRLEDVRAALDPGVGGRSAAYRAHTDRLDHLERDLRRLADARQQQEERDLHVLSAEEHLAAAADLARPLTLAADAGNGGRLPKIFSSRPNPNMRTPDDPQSQEDDNLLDEFEDVLAAVRRQQAEEARSGHPGLAGYMTLGELSQAAAALICLADDAGGTGLELARRLWPWDWRELPVKRQGTGRRWLLIESAAYQLRELARLPRPGQTLADVDAGREGGAR